MIEKKTKILATIGPSTQSKEHLKKLWARGVDFIRVNMSHSDFSRLADVMRLAKQIGMPFVLDTEGSQVRTGALDSDKVYFCKNDLVELAADKNSGNIGGRTKLFLRPPKIIQKLEVGDMLYLDFDNLILQIIDVSRNADGLITAKVLMDGFLGSNKGVAIDSVFCRNYDLPTLSPKDHKAIEMGLQSGVGFIAASFMRSGASVEEVRRVTKNRMKIISKIECVDSLNNLDDIILASDFLLIDRGDLSKEIPLEDLPFVQKDIISRADKLGKGVFVATNLLETMVEKNKPTRAEVHDVVNSVLEGAYGLVLAAETAIGKHPIEAVTMLNRLIRSAESGGKTSLLIEPHGGRLIDRVLKTKPDEVFLNTLPKLILSERQMLDAEQIAIGAFSPLEGFMCKNDFFSVVNSSRLKNGVLWPLPIILDVSSEEAKKFTEGKDVALCGADGKIMAILHLDEKFNFDKTETAEKIYGTTDPHHPGVNMLFNMHPILLGGKIDLIRRAPSPYKNYEMTPKQTRRLFEDLGWSTIVGFHTRNVPCKGHEIIQLRALEESGADGLFIHPIIGPKKHGDFNPNPILKSYELLINQFYPYQKTILAAFATFSRYAGPREALFTAICRKNFGCSHFIVGRDHTGVGTFYHPHASHEIFDRFPEIGIQALKFTEVYSAATDVRNILRKKEMPPAELMRPEVSKLILNMLNSGENVFVN